jgi:DNA-binding beta-propeller fold protein YncE
MATARRSGRDRRRQRQILGTGAVSLATCFAVVGAGPAAAAANPVSVGLPPTAIALDRAAHTAYVAVTDGATSQIAILNTNRCGPVASATCKGAIAAVQLPSSAAPSAIAYDSKNHTVYVTDSGSGGVSMINAATCNAVHTSGCASTPKVANLGLTAPDAIAVDTSKHHDAVYVADAAGRRVVAFRGPHCNATATRGCRQTRSVFVGSVPVAIAVDAAVGTVYVANLASDTVSTLNETACSALRAACKVRGHSVSLGAGADPAALLVDKAAHTLFVSDRGTNAVAAVNTSTCNIGRHKSCGKRQHARHGFGGAAGLALGSDGRVAVAASSADAVLVFKASACNAVARTGCKSISTRQLAGSPVAVAAGGATAYAADATSSSVDIVRTHGRG